MEEKITYEQAKAAKETLIKYLLSRRNGYDGEDTWERYGDEYMVLIALSRDYFLD